MKKIKFGYFALNFLIFSIASCSLIGCTTNSPEEKKVEVIDEETLNAFRQDCYDTIDSYLNLDFYREEEKSEIANIIKDAKNRIKESTSITEIDEICNDTLILLDEVLTDEECRLKEIPTYENSVSTEMSRYYEKLGYRSVYGDINYRLPILVSKPTQVEPPYYYVDQMIDFYNTEIIDNHGWEIAQWASNYDLIGNGEETSGYTVSTDDEYGLVHTITSKGKTSGGNFVPAKQITFNTRTGGIDIKCNCSVEYEKPRTDESWVHVLVQQNYAIDDLYYLGNKESVIMESEFSINSCENKTGTGYNPSAHAAQVVWYLQLRNRNIESEGYGQSIWFGLGVWDSRTSGKSTPPYVAHDAGTGTLIVSPASNETYISRKGLTPNIGEDAKISIDALPLIREAFITARDKGYLSKTNWDDIYITHTNFGLEMPGTFDIDLSYKSIGVFVK